VTALIAKTRNLTCSNGVVMGNSEYDFKVVTTMMIHILIFLNITRVTSCGDVLPSSLGHLYPEDGGSMVTITRLHNVETYIIIGNSQILLYYVNSRRTEDAIG
jgi:hypothetical protein